MPYKERDINKLYYTMGEVTQLFDVNASQIRFYEKEFDILQPKKNKKGKQNINLAQVQISLFHLLCLLFENSISWSLVEL